MNAEVLIVLLLVIGSYVMVDGCYNVNKAICTGKHPNPFVEAYRIQTIEVCHYTHVNYGLFINCIASFY